MVSKKILGAAIAVAFSSQAFAVINLDGTTAATQGLVTYSSQALLSGTGTVNGENSYYIVGGANVLDINSKLGFGVSAGATRFIRIDLTNAVFSSALDATAAGLKIDGAVVAGASVVAGGAVGDNYGIFEVTAPAGGYAPADIVEIFLADLGIKSTGGAGYKFAVYQDAGQAVGQTTPLYSKSLSNIANTADGLKATVTAGSVTADVGTSFKKFVDPDGASAQTDLIVALGKVTVDPIANVLGRTTAADVTLAAQINTGTSVANLTGDFSVGAWSINAAADCSGASTALTFTTTAKVKTNDVTVAALNAKPYVCVTVDGTKVIPKGDYTVNLSYVKADTTANGNAFAISTPATVAGSIVRNGTTIQVPYLTTFSDYTQRLVLVNRGSSDVPYTISFTPEAGVTATAGTAAAGTLVAGKTTIINASDIVSLTGKTRTAATVVISAPAANIDAATTSVNLSDKSTDTVKLQ